MRGSSALKAAEARKRKRRYLMFARAVSAVSALWFPFAYLAFLDPPRPHLPLSPNSMKVIYTLFALVSLWWSLKRGLRFLQQAQTITQLFTCGLACVQGTFLCATFGLFTFLADSPRLGSPLIILPYAAVAVAVDWRYILPQMVAYEPTQADIDGSTA